ncbi:MAG: dihydropteroate synthase [Parvularculaceae bacterium]
MKNRVPKLMGVVNATPDSFSDGGRFADADEAVDHGLALVAAGAAMIDIGGESTRPGADPVCDDEEIARVAPVIEGLAARTDVPLSIDTRKPAVARAAFAAGARIWNDVSALTFDAASLATAAELGADVVLMHAQGDPKTMQDAPAYGDVVAEVAGFLKARLAAARASGVAGEIYLDPGIGFGKTLEHNLALLADLEALAALGAPLLVGASRKRFIAAIDPAARAAGADRLAGSLATAIAARRADVLRVHDVAETAQALAVFAAIEAAGDD